jgi:hypothetical protein
MRRRIGILAAVVVMALLLFAVFPTRIPEPESPAQGLKSVGGFADIADEKARSVAIFDEIGKVLTHPRCANCHPRGDMPLQGDAMTPHQPPVFRGAANFGVAAMHCTSCHGTSNVTYAGGSGSIPGHEVWMLAPASMAWAGLPLAAICEQIKDPARNGSRTLAQLHEHMAEDGLVGWGWQPGTGRTPAPGSQKELGELVQAWIDTGAHCPAR